MKRTPQQIKNLRTVLILQLGPFALLMSDDAIDAWADRLQDEIDSRDHTIRSWNIQVRLTENKQLPWEEITPEPKKIRGPVGMVKASAERLLEKFDKIDAVKITDHDGAFRIIERTVPEKQLELWVTDHTPAEDISDTMLRPTPSTGVASNWTNS